MVDAVESRYVAGAGNVMHSERGKSFEALAVPHLAMIYRVARRLSRSDHEAEDLVQETFLKAHRAFGRFEMREFGIRPWLLRILHNTFLNRQSREKRAPRAADLAALEQTEASLATEGEIGLPELDYERVDGEVKRAIDGLAVEYRSVLLLWATMEMSYQEIAESLGVPIGTVMSRLHRARQQVATALREYAKEHRLATADAKP